ncbi:helix-turn-helix domain-containing protein [Pandoraea horticolens]|uniref:helix-turn-helix domain-containing protein n=1 Tax=Pandoraea horticolens TaxID=2508298 RepID=UPI0012430D56|nr:helix-turn-helix transcriptional regulator [Pandoraea horticolens]
MQRVSAKIDVEGHLSALGSAIRALRTSRGYSQEALALATGIDRSHMGRIERGERNLTLLNLIRIAQAIDCKPSDILIASGL